MTRLATLRSVFGPKSTSMTTWVGCVLLSAGLILFPTLTHAEGTHKIFRDDLIISEVMASWPGHESRGLIITKFHHQGDSGSWMELFNPRQDTHVLRDVSFTREGELLSRGLSVPVGPGDYFYVCHWGPCGHAYRADRVQRISGFTFSESGEVSIFSHPVGEERSLHRDELGWGNNLGKLARRPASGGGTALVRRQDDRGCPADTGDHRSDFHTVDHQPELEGYHHCPGTVPDDANEYIEIYNPTDHPIDPVSEGYRLVDQTDEQGNLSQEEYELVGFPHYPHSDRTELQPGQVGVVLGPDADTFAFDDMFPGSLPTDWRTRKEFRDMFFRKAHEGKVRLYTTRPAGGGELQFMTDGLTEDPAESVRLLGPSETLQTASITPLSPSSSKAKRSVSLGQYQARERPALTSSDDPREWIRRTYGSPGNYRSRIYPLLDGSVLGDTTATDTQVVISVPSEWENRFVQVAFHSGKGPKRTAPDPASVANSKCSKADYTMTSLIPDRDESVDVCLWTAEHPSAVLIGRRADTRSLNLEGVPTESGDKEALRAAIGRTALLVELGDSTGEMIGDTVSTTSVGDQFAYTLVYHLSEQTVNHLKSLGAGPPGNGSAGLGFYYADRYQGEWKQDDSVTIKTYSQSDGSGWIVRVSGITRDLPGALAVASGSSSEGGAGGMCLIQRAGVPRGNLETLRSLRDRLMKSQTGRVLTELYYELGG